MGKQFEFSRARSFVCEEVVSLKYQRKVNRKEGGERERVSERERVRVKRLQRKVREEEMLSDGTKERKQLPKAKMEHVEIQVSIRSDATNRPMA